MAVSALPRFDMDAFFDELDGRRQALDLGWYDLADELWQQSEALNADRPDDHPLCGGAVQRQRGRGTTDCQYALFMLRWLGRAPEDFLAGPVVPVGDTALPEAGPDTRLRWDLPHLHADLNGERTRRGLTWAALAAQLGCTAGRLTNLRTAKQAEMDLVMRVTQWLRRPAAAYIHPARW